MQWYQRVTETSTSCERGILFLKRTREEILALTPGAKGRMAHGLR
jgi:hypothetical protein